MALLIGLCTLMLVALLVLVAPMLTQGDDFLRRAPFDAVRWNGDTPEVEVDGQWYELLELEGIPARDLVEFSKRKYDSRWQKRIEEDLVAVMLWNGRVLGSEVDLRVRPLDGGAATTLENVAMTGERRDALKRAHSPSQQRAEIVRHALAAAGVETVALQGQGAVPELAPFTDVRWNGVLPEIEVGGAWYGCLAIDGTSAESIVDHCKQQHGSKWQKRFGEDLVQVLTEMGVVPGESVTLVLDPLDGTPPITRADVPMTSANRRSVWENAKRRTGARATAIPGVVKRVEREHAAETAPEWREFFSLDVPGERLLAPAVTADEVADDLDQLEWALEDRFSYLERTGIDYRGALDAIRIAARDGAFVVRLQLQLGKLMALFGDGHTRVRGLGDALPLGAASFLLTETAGGIACVRPDRSDFLDPRHPYLVAIEGVDVERWIETAKCLSANYAPAFARHVAIDRLADVVWVARELGVLFEAPKLSITLSDGSERVERVTSLEASPPRRGTWPAGGSRLIDGDIGYLRIASMDGDPEFVADLHERMRAFRSTRGLIVDVRGNGGGTRDALRAVLPYLLAPDDAPRVVNVARYRLPRGETDDPTSGHLENRGLYPANWPGWTDAQSAAIEAFARDFEPEWTPRDTRFSGWHYMVLSPSREPGAFHYAQPVKLLVDTGCFSATDIFASAFQGLPNVELLGTITGGGSGRSQRVTLAHSGIEVRISSMLSYQRSGALYDGNGVAPDVEVVPDATDAIGTTDRALETALARIRGA